MTNTPIHYPMRYVEKINVPELGTYEVAVHTYDTFSCVACVNYENGNVLFHHDLMHTDSSRDIKDSVLRRIREQILHQDNESVILPPH